METPAPTLPKPFVKKWNAPECEMDLECCGDIMMCFGPYSGHRLCEIFAGDPEYVADLWETILATKEIAGPNGKEIKSYFKAKLNK